MSNIFKKKSEGYRIGDNPDLQLPLKAIGELKLD